ncbi:MAG: type III pantothenate kinase [Dehalococcoidales bacterium]|nr:type III pantothenate kinase [Dehalococcoidales bacterium]
MFLAIDIGNTNVTIGAFEGDSIRSTWRLETDIHKMPDEYAATIMTLLKFKKIEITDVTEVALCSTVPPLIPIFVELLEDYFNIKPLVVGAGVKTGVKIRMDNPREVGADRIVNTVAGYKLYGGPTIVVDLGTATTFDTISKEGDFIGGVVAPGPMTAAEALFSRTAALPRIQFVHPQKAIGTNTIAAMQSGIMFGYAGLVEGIVRRMEAELGQKATIVATGGFGAIFAKETDIFNVVNPDITLVGLRMIYQMNK